MRILVVEDEHRIANSIKKGLEQERFVVDLAYDGMDGYDLASSEGYDLLILDLMLPGMDGLSICKELRTRNNHTPILILTARGQTEDIVTGLDAGADDYLTKPFSFDELLARVKALGRRPKTTLGSTLQLEDLSLDTVTFAVSRDGQSVKLSHKEYAILEYLMKHPRQVVTKDQIINHVWNYDANILPNTVEVNIRNLRQKIDLPFRDKKPLIKTIRGFGYQLGN